MHGFNSIFILHEPCSKNKKEKRLTTYELDIRNVPICIYIDNENHINNWKQLENVNLLKSPKNELPTNIHEFEVQAREP